MRSIEKFSAKEYAMICFHRNHRARQGNVVGHVAVVHKHPYCSFVTTRVPRRELARDPNIILMTQNTVSVLSH